MIKLFRALLAVLMAIALPAAAHAEWLEASHKRFLIYADMSPGALKEFATQLERFDSAMRFLFPNPHDEIDSANRVTIYVVDNTDAVQSLGRDRSGQVAGFYRPSTSGSLIVTPRAIYSANQDFNAKLVLFHEYAHHVTLSNSENYYPGWVTEGLAEFFATAVIKPDGSIVIGGANNARIDDIKATSPIPARILLSSDTRTLSDDETIQKYARGWLLIHYLMLGKTRPGQFNAYLAQVNSGVPSVEAAERVFGDLAKLDRELGTYRNQRSLSAAVIAAGKLPADMVTIRPLDAGQAAMMPMRIQSAAGVDAKTAQALVPKARAVGAAYPANSWVQRALAEIEYDAGNDDAAMAASDRALAADPANMMAMIYKGMVAMRRATAAKATDPAIWRDARRWFLKANAVDPDFALPFVLYYESFARAGQRPNESAVQGLMKAMNLVPQDDGVRMTAAFQLLAQGDRVNARRALAPVAFAPHGGRNNRALAMLTLLDSGATTEAVLAAQQAPKDAAKDAPKPKP